MLVIHAPIPSDITCVKSLDTIESLPPSCSAPSIFCPIAPYPNVVQFCIYGDLALIHTASCFGPQPGSNDAYAPALGLLVPLAFGACKSPINPCIVIKRKPVPLRI